MYGKSVQGTKRRRWVSSGKEWFVEYLGISPYTGETYPRVLALAFPPLPSDFSAPQAFKTLPGDASEPFGAEPKLLLQVVNDKASVWGGGFAKQPDENGRTRNDDSESGFWKADN